MDKLVEIDHVLDQYQVTLTIHLKHTIQSIYFLKDYDFQFQMLYNTKYCNKTENFPILLKCAGGISLHICSTYMRNESLT